MTFWTQLVSAVTIHHAEADAAMPTVANAVPAVDVYCG
jgi:hypothetical protein